MALAHFEPYKVTIHPGANYEASCKKLAAYIIDRWMPGNAGGVHIILTPQLAKNLLQFYEKANRLNKNIIVGVILRGNVPNIVELNVT